MIITMKAGLAPERLVDLNAARRHLRLEETDQDAEIQAAIDAASLMIDGPDSFTGQAIVRRDHVAVCNLSRRVCLQAGPDPVLQKVEVLVSAAWQEVEIGLWLLRRVRGDMADLVLSPFETLPAADDDAENMRITVKAGFVASAADMRAAPLRQACLLLAAHYFENRSGFAFGGGYGELPMGVKALIAPFCRRYE